MIKKLNSIVAGVLMSLLAIGLLTGCKGNSSIEQLLETVPQDALVVVAIDGQKTIDALEIKEDAGKYTYCKELGDIFMQANAKPDQIDQALGLIMNTGRAGVLFADGENVWFTFRVAEESKFIDFYKSVQGREPEKEDGVYVLDRTSAMYKNQVWICTSGSCDIQNIRRFADMKKEDSFMKNNKFAGRMASGGDDVTAILNIQKTMQMLRSFGSSSDVAMVQTGLGLLFDDAAYLTYAGKITGNGTEIEVDVLNSDYKPAKFNLPTDKIDMGALDDLKGNPSVVAAVGVPSELVNKLIGLTSAALGSAETELLNSINGTAAIGIGADQSTSFVVSLKNASLASMLQQNFGQLPGMETSIKGNRVVGATQGLSGRGGALNKVGELKGKLAGVVIDFSNVPARMTEGFDLSKIGLVTLFLEKNGDGLRLKGKADIKDPIKTVLNMVGNYINASKSGYDYDDYDMAIPEPDSDEDYEVVEADTVVAFADDYDY